MTVRSALSLVLRPGIRAGRSCRFSIMADVSRQRIAGDPMARNGDGVPFSLPRQARREAIGSNRLKVAARAAPFRLCGGHSRGADALINAAARSGGICRIMVMISRRASASAGARARRIRRRAWGLNPSGVSSQSAGNAAHSAARRPASLCQARSIVCLRRGSAVVISTRTIRPDEREGDEREFSPV